MKIGVLAANQSSNSPPTEFLPKHIAHRLVNRGWADRLSKALIRRCAIRRQTAPEPRIPRSWYIPAKMPPRELPNPGWTKFREPESAQWRKDHRTLDCIAPT